MATEILDPNDFQVKMGDVSFTEFNQFDSYSKVHTSGNLDLLTKSSLSKLDVTLDGTTYSGESATADLKPMAAYAKAAQDSAAFLKNAKITVEKKLELIKDADIDGEPTQSQKSQLARLQLSVVETAEKISQLKQRQTEIDEDCQEFQEKISELQRDGFHEKSQEFDERVKELRDLDNQYKRHIAQDNDLIQYDSLGEIAYQAALGLKNINLQDSQNERASVRAEFDQKWKDLDDILEYEDLLRFKNELMTVIIESIGLVTSGQSEELDRDQMLEDIRIIVEQDLEKQEQELESLDAENKIKKEIKSKNKFLDSGMDNFRTSEISKLEAMIEEFEEEIKPGEIAELEDFKSAAEKSILTLKQKIALQNKEAMETRELMDKLSSLKIESTITDINRMKVEEVDIEEIDASTLAMVETSTQREKVILKRGELIEALKDITLGDADETSVLIAASCDVDKLLVLKSNYLKEQLLNTKRLEQSEQQIEQIDEALKNIELLKGGLDHIQKFIEEKQVLVEHLETIAKHNEDLESSKSALEEKLRLLKESEEDFYDKLDNSNKRIAEINANVSKISPAFSSFAAPKTLPEHYSKHYAVLRGIETLIVELLSEDVRIEHNQLQQEPTTDEDDEEYNFDLRDQCYYNDNSPDDTSEDESDNGEKLNSSLKEEIQTVGRKVEEAPSYEVFKAAADQVPTSEKKVQVVQPKKATEFDDAKALDMSAIEVPTSGLNKEAEDKRSSKSFEDAKVLDLDTLSTTAIKGLLHDKQSKVGEFTAASELDIQRVEVASAGLNKEAEDKRSSKSFEDSKVLDLDALRTTITRLLDDEQSKVAGFPATPELDAHRIDVPSASLKKETEAKRASQNFDTATGKDLANIEVVSLGIKSEGFQNNKASDFGSTGELNLGDLDTETLRLLLSSLPKAVAKEFSNADSLDLGRLLTTLSSQEPATQLPAQVQAVLQSANSSQSTSHATLAGIAGGGGGGGGDDLPEVKAATSKQEGTVEVSINPATPTIEHRNYIPGVSDAGHSLPNKIYNGLAQMLKSSNQEAPEHKVQAVQEDVAPRSKTAELINNVLLKRAGAESSALHPEATLSRYSTEELLKYSANGQFGNRLLYIVTREQFASLASILDHVQGT